MLRKADHVSLMVTDVARSLDFYTRVLGMQETPRPHSFDFPGAWLNTPGFQIHLIGEQVAGRAKQTHPGYTTDELALGRGTHVAFEVDDLAATQQHLRTQGVELVGGPRPRGDGVQQMYICDPDGYVIELFAWENAHS